jgi:uncharacterized protein (DUF2252 family)
MSSTLLEYAAGEEIMSSIKHRLAQGRALRSDVPRSSHGEFVRTGTFDPVELVLSQEEDRLEDLIPVRRERMAESAFAFYRAGAELMASDLAMTPRTGVLVQASGDAHVSNFGWYGSPERALVFDTNDFDETHTAAWEWDVKRLAASFAIAGRDNEFDQSSQRKASRAAARAYRGQMNSFADQAILDVWYDHISGNRVLEDLRKEGRTKKLRRAKKKIEKASKKTSAHVLGKIGEFIDGRYRIVDDPPFIVSVRSMDFPQDTEEIRGLVHTAFATYRESVDPAIKVLLSKYRVIDVALKVVGVGSVGTRCYIAMLEGSGPEDVLFLQIKEAGRSVLEDEFGDSEWEHSGQRVVHGQRLMQTTSDILLGWTSASSGRHYYVRQLKDMKASPEIGRFDPSDMVKYAKICGAVLAHAHARSSDPAVIAGYLGGGSVFDDAVAEFSMAYADQNESDYLAFIARMESDAS